MRTPLILAGFFLAICFPLTYLGNERDSEYEEDLEGDLPPTEITHYRMDYDDFKPEDKTPVEMSQNGTGEMEEKDHLLQERDITWADERSLLFNMSFPFQRRQRRGIRCRVPKYKHALIKCMKFFKKKVCAMSCPCGYTNKYGGLLVTVCHFRSNKWKPRLSCCKPEGTTPEPSTEAMTTAPEPTEAKETTPEPLEDKVTTSEPTTPEVTTSEPTTPEVTTSEPTTPEGTTSEPTTPEETTSEPPAPEPTTPEEPTTPGEPIEEDELKVPPPNPACPPKCSVPPNPACPPKCPGQ